MTGWLASLFGSSQEIFFLALVFIAVMLAALALLAFSPIGDPLRRRLEPADTRQRAVAGGQSIRYTALDRPFIKILQDLGERLSGQDEAGRHSSLRRKLVQAGYFAPSAISIYFAARLVLGAGLPFTFSVLAPFVATGMATGQILVIAAALGFLGTFAPSIWMTLRVRSRQRLAREAFPDSLDMLLICVEAGLGLDAAVDRVGLEIHRAHPFLAMQFAMLSAELRAGRRREDALRNLADRIGIDEVGSLVTLLIQSEKLGTSLAQTLRVHSDEMRAKRMLKAEEKAGMLPVLLSIPLVLCILPALLTVVLTPAIIRVMRQLLPALGGN